MAKRKSKVIFDFSSGKYKKARLENKRKRVQVSSTRKVRQRTWSEFGKQAAGAAAAGGMGAILTDTPFNSAKMGWDALAPNLNIIERKFKMKQGLQANNSVGSGKTFKNKKVHLTKKKQVKVAKLFKLKVQQALKENGKSFIASWRQFTYSGMDTKAGPDLATGPLHPGRQGVFIVGANGGATPGTTGLFAGDFSGAVGNAQEWIYMLSVMYNSRTESQNSRTIDNTQTLGNICNPIGAVVIPGSQVATSYQNNLVFTVKNCYDVYRFKNNTTRSYTIDAYSCKPKSDWSENPNGYQLSAGSASAAGYGGNPALYWRNALVDACENQVNFKNVPIYTYGMNPTSTPAFKKAWDSELTKIVLEPGESFEYKIQGVSNYKVDMTKRWRNDLLHDCGTFTRIPLFILKTDLVQYGTVDAPGNVVRGGAIGEASKISSMDIAVEREQFAQFEMPEVVGGLPITSTAGIIIDGQRTQLGNRFYHKVYASSVGGATKVYRTDDDNPITIQEQG